MTPVVLGILALVVAWVTLTGAAITFVPLSLLIYIKPGVLQLGGVFVDSADVITGGFVTAFLFRSHFRKEASEARFPFFAAWLLLGLWTSAAYLRAELNQRYVADATLIQITYQLYRYVWKDLLYFPIALVLLRGARGRWVLSGAIIAFGIAAATYAIPQGMRGIRAGAPLGGPNALSPALISPIVFTFGLMIADKARQRRWMLFVILAVLARALLFTRSRGGQTGALVGAVVLFGLLMLKSDRRSTVMKWGFAISLLLLSVVLVFPAILERPNVQEALTIFSPGEQHTLQWRTEQRWPYFLQKIKDNPWWGVGTDHDDFFGAVAATPHNGYASIALISGIPAAVMWTLFGLLAAFLGFRVTQAPGWGERHTFAACATASICGLLVHNLIDRVLINPVVSKTFWMMIAVIMISFIESKRRTAVAQEAVDTSGPQAPQLVLAPQGRAALHEGGREWG